MQSPMRLTAALSSALALTIGSFVVGASAEPKPFSLCVVHNLADHPSIAAIVNGMNDEAPLFGAKITYFDPAFDPQKQVAMIEDCIARKADVIAVNAVDPAAVVPALKKAHDAHIPVIMHNADTNDAGRVYSKTYVGVKSYDQGYEVATQLAKDYAGKPVSDCGSFGQARADRRAQSRGGHAGSVRGCQGQREGARLRTR